MVSAILAIFVWIGIAQSMAIIANSGFKSIKSGRTAIQAQQYADISIDRLKNINYDELDTAGAHTRAVISGLSTTDWEDEVTIGAESTIAGSDDVKQRIATVNVYKTGDTLPRYTVEVPLSSQGSNSLPIGTILPYTGDLNKIPSGWHLCDGTDGTPNLLDNRFLEGDATPGIFKEPGLPNITGKSTTIGESYKDESPTGAYYKIIKISNAQYTGDFATIWDRTVNGFDASRSNPLYGNSTTVQPKAYTVMYIIKIK